MEVRRPSDGTSCKRVACPGPSNAGAHRGDEHQRDERRFQQLGAEVFHFDESGRIAEFWALIDDTGAFDEFFA